MVFHSWQTAPGLGGWKDIFLNIGIYMPVGLLAALKLRHRPMAVRLGLPLLLGTALSLAIEVTQVYDQSRFPSGLDWATNTLGTVLGIMIAVLAPHWLVGQMTWAGTRIRRSPAASLLCAAWVLDWLFPWVPLLSLYGWRPKLVAFLVGPWPFLSLVSFASMYLAFGLLIREVSRRRSLLAMLLAVLIVPLQIALLGRQPLLVEFVGALAGFGTFLLLRQDPRAIRIAAVAFAVVLVLRGLSPFAFSMSPAPFEWVPLVATLLSERSGALFRLLEKCAWYGTAVWLTQRAGVRRWPAAIAVAVMLAAIEVMQRWLPGRSPESTDPLIALAMTALFVWVERSVAAHRPESDR